MSPKDAKEAYPLVWTVSTGDGDVDGIVAVVKYADGTSELRGAGRLAAIGMWLPGDVGG